VQGADTLLLVSYNLPDPRPAFTSTASGYFSLYNVTQKKWVYEQMPMVNQDEAGAGNHSAIIGDKVYYTIDMWVGCFELMTGKRVWMKRITPASVFSDMIVAEGKLLANGQDAKLYCLDPETGNILWRQESSGIGSSLFYLNGVVYYIASKNLLAADVATGKLLWNLPCPDARVAGRTDSWFSGFVTGLPALNGHKARIFASTNLNVYCFEAIR
jgi:outer membrane protein assembly factor BamB